MCRLRERNETQGPNVDKADRLSCVGWWCVRAAGLVCIQALHTGAGMHSESLQQSLHHLMLQNHAFLDIMLQCSPSQLSMAYKYCFLKEVCLGWEVFCFVLY